MRKLKKNEIVNLIQTLKEANLNIDMLVKSHSYSEAYEILVTCQEGAISIGTAIENEEEDPKAVITEIEKYCEDIFQFSTNLEKDNYDFDSVFKILNNQLDYIENFVKNNIKTTYEIVFLPYKASMWDSLESVWEAASQDPNCECYVIPIPYYEFMADSNSPVMKYEGTIMPEYVPITSYESYNFEVRKPDIIYIHNPYDKNNYVTSVHPAFYSSELKKYTPLLVYIPYFITGGSIPEALEYLPSYNYIDKIVVQSNKQINFYKKNDISEKKKVALGSPKVDKIYSVINGEKDIPQEWGCRIKNKKVIFYNISISGILKYGEKALVKMEYIFNYFKNREKEILLWRPHPLIKQTLQAMIPKIYQMYCDLEQKFISEKIGILDITPDVTRSVAISDAYIGEESSSIVHLFGVAGKPIFLLDMNIYGEVKDARKNLMGALDVWIDEGKLLFINSYYNAFCSMDINTGNVEIIDKVPKELLFEERLYQDVLKVNNKLYFAPHRAKELAEYDLDLKQFTKIPLKKFSSNVISLFTRMIRYKEYLFFLPTYYPAVARYDINKGSFKYYSNIIDNFKKNNDIKNQNIPVFMNSVYVEGELLLMASAQSNLVIEFNMDTENLVTYKVGKDENSYYRMEYDGIDYWMIPHESKAIVRWNRKTGKTIEYTEFPRGFIGEKNAFLNIIYCGEYMLAFPKNANMIVKIDIETGEMSEFKLSLPYVEGERKEEYYNWSSNYYFVKKINDTQILAMTAYDNSILIIDVKTQCYSLKKSVIEESEFSLEFSSCGSNLPYACRENYHVTIEEFLDCIENKEEFNSEEEKKAYNAVMENMDGSCGRKIHSYMMKQLKIRDR